MSKKEKTILTILYALFAAAAFPVFAGVFLLGDKIPFFAGLKLSLPVPYFLIFLISLILSGVFVFLTVLAGKKEMSEKESWILTGVFAVLCIPLYLVSFRMAKEIAFHLPWDVMVVGGSAKSVAEGYALAYEYYYSIYTNNIPIVYILAKILKFGMEHNYLPNPEYLWIQVLCVLLTLSVLFSTLSVKRLTQNRAATVTAFLMGCVLTGLSAWKTAPYTDAYGALFPILWFYLYICFKQAKKPAVKIILLLLSVLSGGIGGLIKPTVYIVVIALLIAEVAEVIVRGKKEMLYLILAAFTMAAVLFGVKGVKNGMADSMGLIIAPNLEAGVAEYFYMGQNEATTGAYNSDDAAIYGEFQDKEKSERTKEVLHRAVRRMKEKGPFGFVSFSFKKMVMTFSDGTFGWYNEVWIDSFYDPCAETDTAAGRLLRRLYRFEDPKRMVFAAFLQVFWFSALTGIAALPVLLFIRDKKESKDFALNVFIVTVFLGIFFYQLLFEARARYLFIFLPVLLSLSATGFTQLSVLIGQKTGGKKQS